MRAPWLTLVGIGEDGLDGLSAAARAGVADAALVVGGRRHLDLVGGLVRGELLAWASPIEATFPALLAMRPRPVCVVASGDPFCFGIGSVLARHVPAAEMRCFPQPSAFSLAAARLGWALQDTALLSLCGRPVESLVPALAPGARLLVLSADETTPPAIAALLTRLGYGPSRLTIFSALGGTREARDETPADPFEAPGIDRLNTVAVEVTASPAARSLGLVPGRADALFANDGQITRAEIRAVTLARLAPVPGALLWDVGAGSGSVAIEWMLAHPRNRALAIEPRADRAARIRDNAVATGVPALQVVDGTAPDAFAGLPTPDAIFVGGGATREGLLDAAIAALPAGGRLVANAVTIETQARLIEVFRSRGGTLVSLALAHADPVGGFHGWRPAMPVTQWAWVKP